MKAKLIAAIVAVLVLVTLLVLLVRTAIGFVGGLSERDTVVETQELGGYRQGEGDYQMATPDPAIYTDAYYDEVDEPSLYEDDAAPTPSPEVMVQVPVIETPEELAAQEEASDGT